MVSHSSIVRSIVALGPAPTENGLALRFWSRTMPSTTVVDAMTKLVVAVPLLFEKPFEPGFIRDDALQDDLEASLGGGLSQHSFAVVDLTDDALRPAYAGWQDTRPRAVASLGKLLPLYCAYRLRADLRRWSTELSIGDLGVLATNVREEYRRKGAVTPTRPRIEKLAKLVAAGDVDFTHEPKTEPFLEFFHLDTARKARTFAKLGSDTALDVELTTPKFREQLRLMGGWSDDVSAAVVVEALGFHYLWAASKAAGLFRDSWPKLTRNDRDPGPRGGLFIALDYWGTSWMRRAEDAPTAGETFLQAGTARSVASLMTMLAQDRLVDHEAGVAIREMLRKQSDFTGLGQKEDSPIGIGMADWKPSSAGWAPPQGPWAPSQAAWDYDTAVPAADPTADLAVSKIGLIPGVSCNALLVRANRKTSGGASVVITAILVGINNVSPAFDSLETFGRRMAEKLDRRHHVIT
jgi:hypothetical protein